MIIVKAVTCCGCHGMVAFVLGFAVRGCRGTVAFVLGFAVYVCQGTVAFEAIEPTAAGFKTCSEAEAEIIGGTTAVVAFIVDNKLFVANAGKRRINVRFLILNPCSGKRRGTPRSS